MFGGGQLYNTKRRLHSKQDDFALKIGTPDAVVIT